MGGLWPEATEKEKNIGWTLSYAFLEAIKKAMDDDEENCDHSTCMETVELVLLTASKIEIEQYMGIYKGV